MLIIDKDESLFDYYKEIIESLGIKDYKFTNSINNAFSYLSTNDVSLIILNLNIPELICPDTIIKLKEINPNLSIIIMSIGAKTELVVKCMKYGAYDFITSIEDNSLIDSIKNALDFIPTKLDEIKDVTDNKNSKLNNIDIFSKIITNNETMLALFRYIDSIANTSKAVLITGESGTGKELIARAIHDISRRKKKFVAVNVAGLDDTVFSDTLFGHKKGAFTGADETRKGLVEEAFNGTLFLDEIGDLQLSSQVKLLRLLQENEYYSLGSDKPEKSEIRVIASTNADLQYKQENGSFRTDLYYRLNSHHIHLLPLRDRLDDLPLLVDYFLDLSSKTLNKKKLHIPKHLFPLLRKYYFKGNVRELQSMIFDAVSRSNTDELDITYFTDYIKKYSHEIPRGTTSYIGGDCSLSYSGRFPTLDEIEDFFITEALKKAKGNQTIAAQLLGVAQSTLSRRLKSKFDF